MLYEVITNRWAVVQERRVKSPASHRSGGYDTVLTQDALDAWIDKLKAAPIAAFDTETTSLDAMAATLVGLSFAIPDGGARPRRGCGRVAAGARAGATRRWA